MKRILVAILMILSLSLVSCNNCKHPSFTDWRTVTPATCVESGVAERECTECHMKETKTIDPLGHNFVNGVCTVCGQPEQNN